MDLPQELLDMIVDCGPDHGSDGDGDGDGLQFYADCALVCRSLRGRSQYHLYFEVELYSSERIDGLLDIIRNDPLIAWYIRRINTTSQQLIEDYGLDVPLATLLLLIKEHSPQSSLAMTIMGHTGDMFEHDSSPERHLSPEGLVSCLSQVHYLKVKEVEEFPSVILFSFKHLSALCLIKTTFDPELHVIEQRQILQLAAPILRSVTGLELCNIEFFPGVLLSNFETLTTLNLKNVRFAEAAVDLESPRPRILHMELSNFDYQTVRTIFDKLIDGSHLIEFIDGTSDIHYQPYNLAESTEIIQAVQYILNICKHSLEKLSLHYCASLYTDSVISYIMIVVILVTAIYKHQSPQVVFNLSRIPNLKYLTLSCNCFRDELIIKLPLYLCTILRTIDLESTLVNTIVILIRVVLDTVYTDHEGRVRLQYSEAPRIFKQTAWIEIKQIITALANKRHMSLAMRIIGFRGDSSSEYIHHIAPYDEDSLFFSTMTRWAIENIIPPTGECSFELNSKVVSRQEEEDIDSEDDESDESD